MSEAFIGEIRMFGGNFAPQNWLLCDGQQARVQDFQALFSLIGTTYGGDGVNNFRPPDLRSRVPLHQAPGRYAMGQQGGLESVRLTDAQMPAHTHTAFAADGSSSDRSSEPTGLVWAPSSKPAYAAPTVDPAASAAMSGAAVSPSGGNQPHDNMPPFLTLNFIICCVGIWPSRA